MYIYPSKETEEHPLFLRRGIRFSWTCLNCVAVVVAVVVVVVVNARMDAGDDTRSEITRCAPAKGKQEKKKKSGRGRCG
jgi:hypothetical protein